MHILYALNQHTHADIYFLKVCWINGGGDAGDYGFICS